VDLPKESPVPAGTDIEAAVRAARAGDVPALDAWLRGGGDPNQFDREGWTPLLAAAVRGRAGAVERLLGDWNFPANPDLPHRISGALAIHFAGHAGSVPVAGLLLARRPEHLDAVWDINGHTLLLQAAFYGHLDLASFALARGANTAATTVRGLGALDLAVQFQNQAMIEILRPHDRPAEAKQAWYQALLKRIERVAPAGEEAAQQLADQLVAAIVAGLADPGSGQTLAKVRSLVEAQGADVNRLGGPLLQPPLVVVVTGNNGAPADPRLAALRLELADYLLERGADPTLEERHPMAVDAIIRAAVFNHLDILKAMGRRLSAGRLAAALNQVPVVNGLTGFHDTVLRASTAGPERFPGYLDQVRWFAVNGARSDLEDYSGRTQRAIAEQARDPESRRLILEALASHPTAV
jgi:ankyrin repeat protein